MTKHRVSRLPPRGRRTGGYWIWIEFARGRGKRYPAGRYPDDRRAHPDHPVPSDRAEATKPDIRIGRQTRTLWRSSKVSELNQRNKRTAIAFWRTLDKAAEMSADIHSFLAQDMRWDGFAPFADTRSAADFISSFVTSFYKAFDQIHRETHIVMGGVSDGRVSGDSDGRHWVGGTGYLHAKQIRDLNVIPARNMPLRLRWGEFLEFDKAGKITKIQTIIDVIDWLEQINLSPLPKATGAAHVYPPPTGCNGYLTDEQDAQKSTGLRDYARDFIFGGLNGFDQSDLKSMGMAHYFHPNLKWYGPGGIGACLSFKEFEDLHQRPWLIAFPDRTVGDLDSLIAEGKFVGASGMPGVTLTHTGPYLGHTATQARCGVNGIDFWREENGQFVENWVFVDMIHLFDQMGIDLLERVNCMARHQARADEEGIWSTTDNPPARG